METRVYNTGEASPAQKAGTCSAKGGRAAIPGIRNAKAVTRSPQLFGVFNIY